MGMSSTTTSRRKREDKDSDLLFLFLDGSAAEFRPPNGDPTRERREHRVRHTSAR
jgi:hypothetical protein